MIEDIESNEVEFVCGGVHPGALPLIVVVLAKETKQQQSQKVDFE